jgi:hypothetical protein
MISSCDDLGRKTYAARNRSLAQNGDHHGSVEQPEEFGHSCRRLVGWLVDAWYLFVHGQIASMVPRNVVGGLESALVFLAGWWPGLVFEFRRRRLLNNARTSRSPHP